MENIYLIALDLDGTLLNDKSEITPATFDYLKKIINMGHKVVLCSGRPKRAIMPFYNAIGCDTPFVSYNGINVYHPKDDNFPHMMISFDRNLVKSILNDIGENNLDLIMCETLNEAYINKDSSAVREIFWHDDEACLIFGDVLMNLPEDPLTFLLKTYDDKLFPHIQEVINKYPGSKVRFCNGYLKNFCEIYQEHVSKYNALKHIANYYDIPLSNIIAFGDAANDLEMIQGAGIGFAMKNAEERVLAVAPHVTEFTNLEDGVIKELQKIIKE